MAYLIAAIKHVGYEHELHLPQNSAYNVGFFLTAA
jgi:hypothetical protein